MFRSLLRCSASVKPLSVITPMQAVVFNPFSQRLVSQDSDFFKTMTAAGFELDSSGMKFKVPSDEAICWKAFKLETSGKSRGRKPKQPVPPNADPHHQTPTNGQNGDHNGGSGVIPATSADPAPSLDGAAAPLKILDLPKVLALSTPSTATGWKKKLEQLLKDVKEKLPADATLIDELRAKREALQTFFEESHKKAVQSLCEGTEPDHRFFAPHPSSESIELTVDQKNVLQLAEAGFSIYVGGSAGTGKTMLLRVIHRRLQAKGLKVGVCATTGVAGVNVNGCTFHHLFGVPQKDADRWDVASFRAFDAVIIDEVSLLDAAVFDAFEVEARRARLSNAPFGGLQVILCGDFLQLTMKSATETPLIESKLFQEHFVHVQLTSILRHNAVDPLYPMLSKIRLGQWDPVLTTLTPEGANGSAATDSTPNSRPSAADHTAYPADAIWMFPRKKHAEAMNRRRMDAIHGEQLMVTPQRGPLQLIGTFTHAALLELPSSHVSSQGLGMTPGLDPILSFNLHMLLIEDIIQQLLEKGLVHSHGDVVLMPTREFPESKFILRLRQHPDFPVGHELWRSIVERAVRTIGSGTSILHWYDGPEPESMIPLKTSMTLIEKSNSALSVSPLELKVGCRVMILRNLNRQVTNGTVGHVIAFEEADFHKYPPQQHIRRNQGITQLPDKTLFPKLPLVKLQDGSVFQIPPVGELIGGRPETHFYGHMIYSLPMQPGYAFTVHKVQGLTLTEPIVLDLTDYFRCEHLVYVACSRVRSIGQLNIRGITPAMIEVDSKALQFAQSIADAKCDDLVEKFSQGQYRKAAWVAEHVESKPVTSLPEGDLPTTQADSQ